MRHLEVNLVQFIDMLEDKNVICYGAGNAGTRAICLFDSWGQTSKIRAFIDKNAKKNGEYKKVFERAYPVSPFSEIRKFVDEKSIILITTVYENDEIEKQLNLLDFLDNIPYISLIELAQEQLLISDYKSVIIESEKRVIPKIIHYMWIGGEKPNWVKSNIEKWKRMCPDYEIKEWNENNYDFSQNSYIKQAYEAKEWGFVPDFARCDIIYKEGGIYIDTDVEILQNLDRLLYQNCFMISDCTFLPALGAAFGARPGNKLIKEFCEYYNGVNFVDINGKSDKLACIVHQYNVLRKHKYFANDSLQTIADVNIYPMIMGATNAHSKMMRMSPKAYFAHYGMASWMNKKIVVPNELQKKYERKGLITYG